VDRLSEVLGQHVQFTYTALTPHLIEHRCTA
jgi:hypothetical protein